jgi:DNA-binding transcriptional MerR regulator
MTPKFKRLSDSVTHSDHMSKVIRLYFNDKSGKEISEMLNNQSTYVTQEPLTYRQLNHWEESGLLPERVGTGWRRFGLVEALWAHTINELRSTFEVRLEGIKKIMECLTTGPNRYKAFMPVLEIYVSEALTRKRQVYLVVFEDKSAAPADVEMLTEILKKHKPGHLLLVDINKILETLLPKYDWALNPTD